MKHTDNATDRHRRDRPPDRSEKGPSEEGHSEEGRGVAGIPPVSAPLSDQERAVIAALREIAFGEIEVVVHNARIVQITRSQKFRFGER
jgi:hypothetical protein